MANPERDPVDLPVTQHHDIYPGIDPGKYTDGAKGKVAFITGASQGLGKAFVEAFAQAGANIFAVARKLNQLNEIKEDIDKRFPNVRVETFALDVSDTKATEEAVAVCIKAFGKLDIVIANAGSSSQWQKIGDSDPDDWWNPWNVNVKGTYNTARFTLAHLIESKGHLMLISSMASQAIYPGGSSFAIAKLAINRFGEFLHAEYADQGVKVFNIHPGLVLTPLTEKSPKEALAYLIDKAELPAWTLVRLATGSHDWLSGRYISARWDLDEMNQPEMKEKILTKGALKTRPSVLV